MPILRSPLAISVSPDVGGFAFIQRPESVIDWFLQILLGTKITLSSQNRCMAQEKLDLLKFSSVGVAQLGASAPQIVRRNVLKTQTFCAFANDIPNNVLGNSSPPARSVSAHRAKYTAMLQVSRG
jgi:hypothetical protein